MLPSGVSSMLFYVMCTKVVCYRMSSNNLVELLIANRNLTDCEICSSFTCYAYFSIFVLAANMSNNIFNSKLIDVVSNYEVLYNLQHPGYKNRELQDSTWMQVALSMQSSGYHDEICGFVLTNIFMICPPNCS